MEAKLAAIERAPSASPAVWKACPACGAGEWGVALAEPVDWEYGVVPARAFRFLACAACGSEWLDPRPDARELVGFYPPDYHAYNEDHGFLARVLVGLRARLRARQYGAWLPAEGGRVFDVGAGDCRHFRELERRPGFAFAGVEINPELASRARAAGYDVETGTLEEMDLARHLGRYHVVSMNHVLEHVLDPAEVLRRSFALLVPGGRLVGQIPTVTSWEHAFFGSLWAGYHFPRHTQLFSRAGLARIVTDAGFANVRLRSAPHAQAALSVQNWLVSRGFPGRRRFGKTPYFSLLMLGFLPVEVVSRVLDRSGIIDFEAEKPERAA